MFWKALGQLCLELIVAVPQIVFNKMCRCWLTAIVVMPWACLENFVWLGMEGPLICRLHATWIHSNGSVSREVPPEIRERFSAAIFIFSREARPLSVLDSFNNQPHPQTHGNNQRAGHWDANVSMRVSLGPTIVIVWTARTLAPGICTSICYSISSASRGQSLTASLGLGCLSMLKQLPALGWADLGG